MLRPIKPKSKWAYLHVRMTRREYSALKKMAKRKTVSEFIRKWIGENTNETI